MNNIGRLLSQVLAAIETAGSAAGVKSGRANGTQSSLIPPADFGGHLADLVQRDAQSNLLDGKTRDTVAPSQHLAGPDFSAGARPGVSTPLTPRTSALDECEVKPRDPMTPGAAVSRPGTNVLAARGPMLSAGAIPPEFRQPDDGRRPKPTIQLGDATSSPAPQSLPAGYDKPLGRTKTFDEAAANSSANIAMIATVRPPLPAEAPRPIEATGQVPRQPMPGLSGSLSVSANEAGLLAVGVLGGASSKTKQLDLFPAAEGDDGSPVAFAAGHASVAASGRFDGLVTETHNLEKSFSVDAIRDREPYVAQLMTVRVTAASQETQLPPANQFFPSRQSAALNRLSSQAGEAGGDAVPGKAQPQTADVIRDSLDPRIGGPRFAKIPVEPNGNSESLVSPSDRASASAVAEPGDLISRAEVSPAGKFAAFSASLVEGTIDPQENIAPPTNTGFDSSGPEPQETELARVPVEHKCVQDSLAFPLRMSLASAGNERDDLLPASTIAPSENIAASNELRPRPSRIGGFAIAKESPLKIAYDGIDTSKAQPIDGKRESVRAEPTDVPGNGGFAPPRATPAVFDESDDPVSAKLLSPAMQIANSIAAPADFGGTVPKSVGTQPDLAIERADKTLLSVSRVQILHLQLEPENLGKVTVKMRLTGPRLELQVAAERPETVRLIGNDKELLSRKLQSAGYAVGTLVIQTADSQAPQPGQATGTGTSQQQHADHANGGPTAHDRPSMREDKSHSHPILEDDTKDAHRIRAADGELYL